MSDLIRRESLKQRINLNYNSHQYIDTQSIKDIINTEPSVEDKTVEELENIKAEIKKMPEEYIFKIYSLKEICKDVNKIIDNHIEELKGEIDVADV